VINVWTAIGCAARDGLDQLRWLGRDKIVDELQRTKDRFGIDNERNSLASLFPTETCVGLAPLTTRLLMLYAALKLQILDLRQASSFFSRGTTRYKTTLCKLYQIALILGAMDMAERTDNVCEVKVLPPFSTALHESAEKNPLAIANLLNRATVSEGALAARRREFQAATQGRTLDA
jgi:hypothetical protein